MLNVQCPSCSAPYSLSEKRVPAAGMKMRCPKCGSSFTVAPDGSVKTGEPAMGSQAPGPESVGAPLPPPKKKPIFAVSAATETPSSDPFGADLDIGLPITLDLAPDAVTVLEDSDFGALDLGLDFGKLDHAGKLEHAGDDDLPAPRTAEDLPAPRTAEDLPAPRAPEDLPAPVPPRPPPAAASTAPPRPPAPSPAPRKDDPVTPPDDDFDDLPAPAAFDDLPAPAGFDTRPLAPSFDDLPARGDFDDLPAPGPKDDLPAARNVPGRAAPTGAAGGAGETGFDLAFGAELDGGPARAPTPPPPSALAPGKSGKAAASSESDDAGPQIKVKKKRYALKLALVLIPTLAIAGGALSLTPMGPYGYFAITDKMNRKVFVQQLEALRAEARTSLGKDTATESEKIVNQARSQQATQPRFAPIAHYTALVALLNSLRFGAHGELEAAGKTLLQRVAGAEDGPLRHVALAGSLALDGKLDEALAEALAVAEQQRDDLDALVMAGEIALLAKKAEVASKQWQAALALEKSARTHYGLARAKLLEGDERDAVTHAEQTIVLSPEHAGARTLIASTLWRKDSTEARANTLLGEVIAKGPIRGGASTAELVRAYNLRGYIQLRHSQLTAAEKTFGLAVELDPRSEEALIGNGELLYQAGRYTDAIARFEAAQSVTPNSVLAAIGIAKVKLGQELLKEGLADLVALNAKAPEPLVRYWLGRAYNLSGKRADAEKFFRLALATGGDTEGVVRAYVALAELLASLGKAEAAAKVLEEAATKLPQNFDLQMAKGEVALSAARLEEAKTAFQTALSIDEQNLGPMYKLGVVHRKSREYDEAKKRFEAVAAVDPNYPGLALEWGLWYAETGLGAQALKMYQDALQKAPDDIDLMFRVGTTQVLNGQSREAIQHLEKVFAKRRTSPDVNYFLGRAYLQEGDSTRALNYLRTAARGDSNRADYQLYFGWAAADSNQQTEAEKAIEAALALDATLADAYWQRGVLLQRKGKVHDALAELKTAVELSPLRFEAYAMMAVCYGELTQQSEAEDAWKMALAGREFPEWHYRLAKLLVNKNDKEQAIEHFKAAVDGATKALDENKSLQPPSWLANANYEFAELIKGKDKPRALKAFLAYLRLAPATDAFRKDAEAAVRSLGGRVE